MSALNDLLVFMRRFIPVALRPEAEGDAVRRVHTSLRSGWLFDLVWKSAADYYHVALDEVVLDRDITEDVGKRIEGIAKMIAKDANEADAIASAARVALDSRIRNGFLAKIARSAVVDLLRTKARQEKRDAGSEQIDNAARRRWQAEIANPGPSEEEPAAVRDVRIRMVFGRQSASKAHEMAVFAWCPPRNWIIRGATGRSPQAVVEDLSTSPVRRLAAAWVEFFAEIEERDPAEVRYLFDGLEDKASHQRLFEFWDPAEAVAGWIQKVEKEIPVRNPQAPFKAPLHARVAYLYHRQLGFGIERIIAQLGPRRLDQLTADFVPGCAALHGRDPADVRAVFAAYLAHTNVAHQPLNYYYKPHEQVIYWQHSVLRRLATGEFNQLRHGLALILGAGSKPWESLAFLHCRCLGKTPVMAAREYRRKPLNYMRVDLVTDLVGLWNLSEKLVLRSIKGLSRALIAPGVPATLEACADAGGDLAEQVRGWSDRVYRAVEPKFIRATGLRLFALRHGLPLANEVEA